MYSIRHRHFQPSSLGQPPSLVTILTDALDIMATHENRFPQSTPVLKELAQINHRTHPSPLSPASTGQAEEAKPVDFIDGGLGLLGNLQKAQDDYLRPVLDELRELIAGKLEVEQYKNESSDHAENQTVTQILEELRNFKQEVAQRLEKIGEPRCPECDHCLRLRSQTRSTSIAGPLQTSSEDCSSDCDHETEPDEFCKRLSMLGEPERSIHEHDDKLLKDLGLPDDTRPPWERTMGKGSKFRSVHHGGNSVAFSVSDFDGPVQELLVFEIIPRSSLSDVSVSYRGFDSGPNVEEMVKISAIPVQGRIEPAMRKLREVVNLAEQPRRRRAKPQRRRRHQAAPSMHPRPHDDRNVIRNTSNELTETPTVGEMPPPPKRRRMLE